MKKILAIWLVIIFFSTSVLSAQDMAIRAGTVIPVVGKPMKDVTILIKNRRIVAIGKKIKIPWNVKVIDAQDKVVIPGMVLAYTTQGANVVDENLLETPFLSITDSLDPSSTYFQHLLRDGITSALIMPGDKPVVGGLGVVVRPHGEEVEDMTFLRRAALKASLAKGKPGTARRFRQLEKILEDAHKLHQALKKKNPKAKSLVAQANDKKRPYIEALEGRIPVYITCGSASDVARALKLRKKYGFRLVVIGGLDIYRAAPLLKEHKVPVILPTNLIAYERTDEGRVKTHHLPAILHRHGIEFTMQIKYGWSGAAHLWYQAAIAVQGGVPVNKALEAVTMTPARLLGLDKDLGSIEKGKLGNLVILSGSPLKVRTYVEQVIIEGKPVYDKSKDPFWKRMKYQPKSSKK